MFEHHRPMDGKMCRKGGLARPRAPRLPGLLLLVLFAAAATNAFAQATPSLSGGTSTGSSEAGATSAATSSVGSIAPGGFLEGPIDPARYRLGPGDLLVVRIELRPSIDRVLRLSPEGVLILPEGPSVPLAGVTLASAESTVTSILSRYYKHPNVRLNLLELRTFGVFVVGEVLHVGVVQATAVDRASELIKRAGGLKPPPEKPLEPTETPGASSRAIRLTRANGEALPVDLGLFEATGNMEHNPVVEAGDRLYVPPMVATATVSGAVRKPGEIEVIPGDSVATAIALAHGPREDALLDSAYVESFDGSPTRSVRRYLDLRNREDRRFRLHERDLLFVRPRPNWTGTRTVVVKGEVRYPGTHALPTDSLSLSETIRMAGGFTELASLGEAYVMRRREELPKDPEFERLSKLATTEMTPDEYDYYMLKLRSQQPVVSVDFVALFLHGDSKYDINVRSGDEINIPRTQPYVTVVGEVTRPGNIPFDPEMSVDQYITRSGGYTWRADRGNVSVIRAVTGEWSGKGKGDRLGPGDTIWIPRRPRRDYWKGFLITINLVAQLATIYLVIDTAAH
jgi:protein involved in polysaccharide export with SLBB domain